MQKKEKPISKRKLKKEEQAAKLAAAMAEISSNLPEKLKDAYPHARMKKRRFILHIGPTNSGKTYTALQRFREAEHAVYLAPLRLLALEIYENTNKLNVPCSLLTGEEEDFVTGATHISETIEMANMVQQYDVAVIDEAQMISDETRGGGWTAAILGLNADEIHICMAPHAESIITKLIQYCGDEIVDIQRTERLTPLTDDKSNFQFPNDVQPGDALIVFSRRSVVSCSAELQEYGIQCSMIYGALPYETRKAETERFLNKETQVVVATDAIGMGLNLPIKRVIFMETEKFDGYEVRMLRPEEIHQIAGRAGRKGIYDQGFYTARSGKRFIRSSMKERPDDIVFARIRFPQALINVEDKLSTTMKRWAMLELEPMFLRSDMAQELQLCQWLEHFTSNKELIYKLINIPFDIENESQLTLWQELSSEVLEKGYVNLAKHILPDSLHAKNMDTNRRVKQLESDYQTYDLLHNFVRLFGHIDSIADDKEEIRIRKKEISKELTKILKEKKLSRRQCPECGKVLPFNYKFGICQNCYNARRYGGWE